VILTRLLNWESRNDTSNLSSLLSISGIISGTTRPLPEPERPTMEGYPQRRTITTHSTVETRSRPNNQNQIAPEVPGQLVDPEPS